MTLKSTQVREFYERQYTDMHAGSRWPRTVTMEDGSLLVTTSTSIVLLQVQGVWSRSIDSGEKSAEIRATALELENRARCIGSFVNPRLVPIQPKLSTCVTCDGTGFHHCECETRHECGICNNSGKAYVEAEMDPVEIAPKTPPLNRNLVAEAIYFIPDDIAVSLSPVTGNSFCDVVVFGGGGVTAMVCPMDTDDWRQDHWCQSAREVA